MTPVVVAIVSGLFGLATIVVQARVHRDNRRDHADTARKVDAVLEVQAAMHTDLRVVKDDLRDVKGDLRDHSARLRVIEAPVKIPRARKKASS